MTTTSKVSTSPFVHEDLNSVLDYGNYKTEIYPHMNLQIGYTDGGTEIFDFPEGHPDHGKRSSRLLLLGFSLT